MEEVLASLQRMRVALPPVTPPLVVAGLGGSAGRLHAGASAGAPSVAALERIRRARAAQATTLSGDKQGASSDGAGGTGSTGGAAAAGAASPAGLCPFAAGRGEVTAAAAAAAGASGGGGPGPGPPGNASVYLEHTFSTIGHGRATPIAEGATVEELVLAYGYEEEEEEGAAPE